MTQITKLLVANRGEIASRIMRTARQMDIATVAIFSDADAGASFVMDADEAVRLPGYSPTDTYLNIERIVGAARSTGADAVHPGYGFLSERAEFARSCSAAGLVFVGPPAEAIEAMGSKTSAKKLMAAANVPVLPGIVIDDADELSIDLTDQASTEVGYPLLVKAVYGGGGRGMRVVNEPGELLASVDSARREALSAFGNGSVFLEHYVETPRHIEVQIFGDAYGTVVHLFERECSIQRRYQKVIEESPSPVVDDRLRSSLGEAAVAAGRAIGYVGAGTVEFVLDAQLRFFFLEVNTRLQVEHPVTEMVTGLDLVRLQLLVAEGRPLPLEVLEATISGHAIEARLYAEDVTAGFLPGAGTVHYFEVPAVEGVRVDAGIANGSVVSTHYDAMLAKVVAHGIDRDQARRRLATALDRTRLHGVPSNRQLLVGILRDPEFAAGSIDTGFIGRKDVALLQESGQNPERGALHGLAAALAAQASRRAHAKVVATLPSGWRNVVNDLQRTTLLIDGERVDVSYRFGRDRLVAEVDGRPVENLRLCSASSNQVDLDVKGVRRTFAVHRAGAVCFVDSSLGSTVITEMPRFPEVDEPVAPGSLVAPWPGTVVRIDVETHQPVATGAIILVLEAMKMEHSVVAPYEGTVSEIGVSVGQSVEVGTVLAVIEVATDVAVP